MPPLTCTICVSPFSWFSRHTAGNLANRQPCWILHSQLCHAALTLAQIHGQPDRQPQLFRRVQVDRQAQKRQQHHAGGKAKRDGAGCLDGKDEKPQRQQQPDNFFVLFSFFQHRHIHGLQNLCQNGLRRFLHHAGLAVEHQSMRADVREDRGVLWHDESHGH